MKRPALHKVLMDFIEKREYKWYKKVSLYSIAEDWDATTVARTLRKLAEEGKLERGEYDGKYAKGLVRYKLPEPKQESLL